MTLTFERNGPTFPILWEDYSPPKLRKRFAIYSNADFYCLENRIIERFLHSVPCLSNVEFKKYLKKDTLGNYVLSPFALRYVFESFYIYNDTFPPVTKKEIKIHKSLYITWIPVLIIAWIFSGFVQFLFLFLTLIILYSSVLLHEFGHVFVAKKLGYISKKITLFILGGIAEINLPLKLSKKDEFLIAIAGPIVSLLLAGLFYEIYKALQFDATWLKSETLYMAYYVNLNLFLFNMLPIFPLDGGRILRSILGYKFTFKKATKLAKNVADFGAVCVMICALTNYGFLQIVIMLLIVIYNRRDNR
jgi:Zn-dependent protease